MIVTLHLIMIFPDTVTIFNFFCCLVFFGFFFFPQHEKLPLMFYIEKQAERGRRGQTGHGSSEGVAQQFVWHLPVLNHHDITKYHYPSFEELAVSLDIILYKTLFNFHVTISPFLFEIIGT